MQALDRTMIERLKFEWTTAIEENAFLIGTPARLDIAVGIDRAFDLAGLHKIAEPELIWRLAGLILRQGATFPDAEQVRILKLKRLTEDARVMELEILESERMKGG